MTVPAIERDWCIGCGADLRRVDRPGRWAHYLEHIRTDPIPDRYLTAPERRIIAGEED